MIFSLGCAADSAGEATGSDGGASDGASGEASGSGADTEGDPDSAGSDGSGGSAGTDGPDTGSGDPTGGGDTDGSGDSGDSGGTTGGGSGGPDTGGGFPDTHDVNGDGVTVIGYFAQWGIYARDYQVWEIPEAIDVVQYAFWDVAEDGKLVSPDAYADLEHHNCSESLDPMCSGGSLPWDDALPYYGNLRALNMLQQTRGTKVVLSLGGWTLSSNFSSVAADPSRRQVLAEACRDAIEQYGFDGIDLDWEFPVEGGNNIPQTPEDRENFTTLVAEIREAIGEDKILSAAVSPNPGHAAHIDGAAVTEVFDYVSVMAYDYHGAWDPVTGHNAPLNPQAGDGDFNVTKTVEAWNASGFPMAQLMLGVPWYGRSWQGVSCESMGDSSSGLGCEASGAGPGTWEDGVLDYQDVRTNYLGATGWVSTFDDATQTPILYNPDLGRFVTYDDARSIEAKVDYAAGNEMGGLMIWELDADRSGELLDAMLP